jgi:hypothetical protein
MCGPPVLAGSSTQNIKITVPESGNETALLNTNYLDNKDKKRRLLAEKQFLFEAWECTGRVFWTKPLGCG